MILKVRALKGYRLVFTGWILTSWQRGQGGLPWVIVQDQTPVGWSTIGAAPVGSVRPLESAIRRCRPTGRVVCVQGDHRRRAGRGSRGSTGTHWATVW